MVLVKLLPSSNLVTDLLKPRKKGKIMSACIALDSGAKKHWQKCYELGINKLCEHRISLEVFILLEHIFIEKQNILH